jgi:hypothetical protein
VRTDGLGDFCFTQFAGGRLLIQGRRKNWGSIGSLLERRFCLFLLKDRFGAFLAFSWSCSCDGHA